MRRVQVREAKAQFSELVAAAERGEPSLITRHGRPAAAIMPVSAAESLFQAAAVSFGAVLLGFPGGVAGAGDAGG